ncbi:MAG: DUF998 domain-containing protein [Intrasporangium sp.]|uniref:DUF998 domain-containing protein n=1 Tax=Intrasporangium sp. TaxID=1925024 RepID=UPI0026479E41|nr:DUF998 domain-containing protein [Intrasporangium sp.]MDN5796558.1 DUF998 domain-containing protein [Intrasporangium sp.]
MSATEPGRPGSWGRASLVGAAGVLGASGAVVFLTTLAALHVLRPDVGIASDYVSDYANGPYGAWFTVALYAHGVGNLALATGLVLTLVPSRSGGTGSALLGVAAAGVLVAATFPTDPPGAPSVAGTIHRAAVTGAFPIEVLALVLLGSAFKSSTGWPGWRRPTWQTAGLAALTLTWFAVAVARDAAPGIPERILLTTLAIWELSASVRLGRIRRSQRPADAPVPPPGEGERHARTTSRASSASVPPTRRRHRLLSSTDQFSRPKCPSASEVWPEAGRRRAPLERH